MQKSLLFAFTLVLCLHAFSQTQEPNRISVDKVKKKVIEKFREQHPQISGERWYPYPNRYWKNEAGATPFYFPVMYTNHVPDYYEVRFTDDRGKIRKVYHRTGSLEVTSREIQAAALPGLAKDQLEEKGYADWSLDKIERMTRAGQQGTYFKVWLSQGKKNRIVFFDQEGKLSKTMNFDNDLNFVVNDNAKLKQAPGTRPKRKLEAGDVPSVVKNKAKKDHVDVSIVEWSAYERIYDPFATGNNRSFYDLVLPVFYEATMEGQGMKFRAIYTANGELMEIAEVVTKKDLPKAVRTAMKAKLYKDWKFDKEQDKITLEDGRVVYRLLAIADGQLKMAILNERGTYQIN